MFEQIYHGKEKPHPFFVNNANAALRKALWCDYPFDESLSGLEDMHLGKRLWEAGYKVGTASKCDIYHIHDESWSQVRWRYEREAVALQDIDPALHMSRRDLIRCIARGIKMDSAKARQDGKLVKELLDIVNFRVCQYWGSYVGSRASRRLSSDTRRRYFFPTT